MFYIRFFNFVDLLKYKSVFQNWSFVIFVKTGHLDDLNKTDYIYNGKFGLF